MRLRHQSLEVYNCDYYYRPWKTPPMVANKKWAPWHLRRKSTQIDWAWVLLWWNACIDIYLSMRKQLAWNSSKTTLQQTIYISKLKISHHPGEHGEKLLESSRVPRSNNVCSTSFNMFQTNVWVSNADATQGTDLTMPGVPKSARLKSCIC